MPISLTPSPPFDEASNLELNVAIRALLVWALRGDPIERNVRQLAMRIVAGMMARNGVAEHPDLDGMAEKLDAFVKGAGKETV